jgi:DNA-binding winged helix-turn-helix (wHTH) protein
MNGGAPLPVMVLRQAAVPPSSLGVLAADERFQLTFLARLTASDAAFANRGAGCLIACSSQYLRTFVYAVTAGLTDRPTILAVGSLSRTEKRELIAAGVAACVDLPLSVAGVARIYEVLTQCLAPGILGAIGGLTLDPVSRTIRTANHSTRLTPREFAVLHCLCEQHGRPLSTNDLVSLAWGDEPSGSAQALHVHVHQLRRKLSSIGLTSALQTVRGFVYAVQCSDRATSAAKGRRTRPQIR